MENKMRHEVWSSWRDGDFQEDEVWDVQSTKPSSSTRSLVPTEPRMIPERQRTEEMAHMRQHSAPVNVPDWSMLERNMKTKKVNDDDDDENMSPEEYFMRRSKSSSSSSIMEGVGRRLKGRDLSKVRYAVLKQTGFLE